MAKHPISDVVIVVPGILGSTLGAPDTNLLWAVARRRLLPALGWLALNKSRLTLPESTGDGPGPDEVTSIGLLPDLHSIPHLWTIDGYSQLIDHLESNFDLHESSTARPGNFVKFHYDWRLSNRFNGRRLHREALDHLARWRKHSDNPDAKLILICHSMGGLVARWFLDVEGGYTECRKLITIGTPYQGAPKAIDAIVNGVHKGIAPIDLNLDNFVRSLPSVHQLLPVYPCVGQPDTVLTRPTDTAIPRLTTPLAIDAAKFHKQLADGAHQTNGTYQVFALKGQFQPTPQVARLDPNGLSLDTLETRRFRPLDLLRERRPPGNYRRPGPDGRIIDVVNSQGDGTVPRAASHPAIWAHEDDRDNGAHVQGFTAGHAHVQNHQALFDSIDQILTNDRLGLTAASGGYGLDGPEVIPLGDTYYLQATGDGLRKNPPLVAIIDGDERNPIELINHGEGFYDCHIDGLTADTHLITVYSATPRNPIEPTDILVTVVPETHDPESARH